jgi:hypothetical protein
VKGAIPILAGQSQNREFLNYDVMKEEEKNYFAVEATEPVPEAPPAHSSGKRDGIRV